MASKYVPLTDLSFQAIVESRARVYHTCVTVMSQYSAAGFFVEMHMALVMCQGLPSTSDARQTSVVMHDFSAIVYDW